MIDLIKFEEILYNNEKRVAVIFKFNQTIIDKIKNITGRLWDKDNKYWHLPYVSNYEIFYSQLLTWENRFWKFWQLHNKYNKIYGK